MDRITRVILLITLASLLTLGLVASGCPGEPEQSDLALGRITGCSMDSAQSPELGKPAPDFQFQTPEGQPSSLSDFQGRPVLLNFWATWCNPCVHEMPFIQQVYEERQGEELVLLAINIGESPSQAAEFMQSYGFSFPVLLDSDAALAQRYNIQYIPTTFFIDKDGIIKDVRIGAFQSKAEIESILSKLD
jgi:cytochrome c biogenesis protein CcmG/thiol:disulfide interchange protein DsbE